jgi:tRNA pseudouridine38-40 synthase
MEPEQNAMNEPALRRVRLRVGYHGAAYSGFQINPAYVTIEGVLTDAISKIVRHPVHLSTAGRTDAGVHAIGQVITCDIPEAMNLHRLVRSVNGLCAPHIAVSDAQWVSDDFDARYSATWRQYKYTVVNTWEPQPMLVDRSWHVREPLSIPLMNLACDALYGEQDFAAFCRKPLEGEGEPVRTSHRYLFSAKWTAVDGGLVVFDIRANAFCHQMVRGIVGFLVDVGRGRRPPSDTRAVLLARDRAHGSAVAPAQGLTFWDVGYDGVKVHPRPHS